MVRPRPTPGCPTRIAARIDPGWMQTGRVARLAFPNHCGIRPAGSALLAGFRGTLMPQPAPAASTCADSGVCAIRRSCRQSHEARPQFNLPIPAPNRHTSLWHAWNIRIGAYAHAPGHADSTVARRFTLRRRPACRSSHPVGGSAR